MLSKLQYVSQGKTAKEQEKSILKALENGVKWVQFRWKNASIKEFQELGIKVKNYCHDFGARCIINDHISVARIIAADGVHLGLKDDPVVEARKILGRDKIIGGTANTIRDIRKRIIEKCDYIGLGPFSFTSTKEKLSPILGLKGYQDIFLYFQEKEIELPPIFAIGGIQMEDIELLKKTGVYGIAVSSLIVKKPELIPVIKTILNE